MINNLKKLAKTVVVVSAAALASTVGISSASAFSLRYESGPGSKVVGIDNLVIEGEEYNVDFLFGSYESIFDGSFDFDSSSARSAADAIVAALGSTEYLFRSPTHGQTSDIFYLPFEYAGSSSDISIYSERYRQSNRDMLRSRSTSVDFISGYIPYAKFSSGEVPEPPAATPEPSLILGFITVGGLMLGSKRKTKG